MRFINRINELGILKNAKDGLIVIFGRRRVGKTSLVEEWAKGSKLQYSQAIEGAPSLQISQLVSDLKPILPTGIVPRSWSEFLSSLALVKAPVTLVIDEFPYLVKSSSEVPSIVQHWIDHEKPEGFTLILLGSSQTMMHGLFLNSTAPLYERAQEILHLSPLSYLHFCEALGLDPSETRHFELFSVIGGIPKYWEFVDVEESVVDNATKLFFSKSARLESEPDRLLKDENIVGTQAKSMLECIGRGASRPSEIASRLGIQQSSLSTAIQLLMQACLIDRTTPFPSSVTNSKKSLYQISDFALRFWYRVYSPHRSRWHLYTVGKKETLIHEHASLVLEDCFRALYKDACRYWEGKNLEIDSVRYDPDDSESVIITEIKHKALSSSEKDKIRKDVLEKFERCKLAKKFKVSKVEVLGTEDVLERLSNEPG